MFRTSGAFLLPTDPQPFPATPAGPIGIVSDDLAEIAAYLEKGAIGPYVVIRQLADVPKQLGGLAILSPHILDAELRDALTKATLKG